MAQTGITAKNFNEVAQFAHFGMAGLIFTALGKFLHDWRFWALVAFGLAVAAWKEFYWDERYEDAETRGSSLEDFCFYALGIAAGVILSVI